MCDTLIALPGATLTGGRLFAKNSDRERNEAQLVELLPAASHASGGALRLTYITIAQAERTHACLICRPFWMWGAEMGANEHGLVIGNEAVQSVVPASRRRALTGMDLVRLGLERAASAAEALEVMTGLLERHGQGGDCGHLNRFYYHNSFLIADRREAYVLETVGRWWAVQRVTATRAISNALSIDADIDAVSADLAGHATKAGWRGADGSFDFAARLIDKAPDPTTQSLSRCARASALLAAKTGRLTARDMKTMLRDHGSPGEAGPDWSPWSAPHRTLCMHAGAGPRRSQTTGAMVSEARAEIDIHWVTASAAPCLSLFKPVLFTSGLPDQGPAPTDRFDAATTWWRHEQLHRAVLPDFAARAASFRADRDALEARFAERIAAAMDQGPHAPAVVAAVAACWSEAALSEDRWLRALAAAPAAREANGPDARSWRRLDRRAEAPSGD